MTHLNDADVDEQNAKARRGRTARQRGNGWERTIAADLVGIGFPAIRTGQYGGKTDVHIPGSWVIQAKKGKAAIPGRIWDHLITLMPKADEARALALSDAPGPGKRARRLIVLEYETWLDLIAKVHAE